MKNIFYIIFAIALTSMTACEKNNIADSYQSITPLAENANVKFINAYTSNVPAGAPGVGATRFYIYQNGNKLNGNALSTAGSWPGPSTYSSLPVSNTNFTFSLDRRVGNDYGKPAVGDTAFKGNLPITAGNYYSVFMIGQSPTQSLHIVEDKIPATAENNYSVRFGNFVVAATPSPIDVFSRRQNKIVVSGLDYKSVSNFVQLPIATGANNTVISDTLDVRASGQTKTLYSFTNFLPATRRAYTFYTYGRTVAPFTDRILLYTNR